MKEQNDIKKKFIRINKILTAKPDQGLGTGSSKTKIIKGLSCETKEGDWILNTDMSDLAGGFGNAPTPGVLGRAALGSCLAICYMMYASKLDLVIESLEVEIQADYDDGALFDANDSPAGYSEIRYIVRIKSPASPQEIENLLNLADQHSPYLDVFSRAQSCVRTIELIKD